MFSWLTKLSSRSPKENSLNLMAERVQAAVKDLSREKTQLAAVLSNMVEAVVAVDAAGRVMVVNPALSNLFGVDIEQALGKPFLEVLRHNQLNILLGAALRENKSSVEEVQIFAPEERVLEAHAAPLPLQQNEVGALLVLHDITRLRQLEQVRKDFVANVSHELKTPVASIKGFAETLRLGALDDPKHGMEFVVDIETQADQMAKLVDDLLELSAIESGGRLPRLAAVSIEDVAREAAQGLKLPAQRRQVTIAIKPFMAIPPVLADKGQLRQVLANLIDNAIKFNKEKGTVSVSASAGQGMVTVSVCDTGVGIPSQDIARIFERFYRVDSARSRDMGGTGLGLSIVKHILELHGGSISVESKLGQGSTFHFTLPVA